VSKNPIIAEFEKSQLKSDVPGVRVGNTVQIFSTIVEGSKKRIQKFEGDVIKLAGTSSLKTVTVRKVVSGVGIEKTFYMHSPLVTKIVVLKKNSVRKAKLYYLRGVIGAKANRLKKAKSER